MFSGVYWNQPVCPYVCVSICVSICVQNISLCQSAGDGINPFPNKPWFLCVCSTSLLKTLWEMEKSLVMRNFSFSLSVFYLFEELSAIFNEFEIVVCKLFQFGLSLKFVVLEGVKSQLVTALVFLVKCDPS